MRGNADVHALGWQRIEAGMNPYGAALDRGIRGQGCPQTTRLRASAPDFGQHGGRPASQMNCFHGKTGRGNPAPVSVPTDGSAHWQSHVAAGRTGERKTP